MLFAFLVHRPAQRATVSFMRSVVRSYVIGLVATMWIGCSGLIGWGGLLALRMIFVH